MRRLPGKHSAAALHTNGSGGASENCSRHARVPCKSEVNAVQQKSSSAKLLQCYDGQLAKSEVWVCGAMRGWCSAVGLTAPLITSSIGGA